MPACKVSIILLAYNHEAFIEEALRSILSQQTDFAYEVIVGEDCSTDQTRALVQAYAQRYPEQIRPIYQPRNVGPGANVRACWAACTGQYIAVLDGDDYWTSPHKLARQVACLDAEPALSFCFHYVEFWHEQQVGATLFPPLTEKTHYAFTDFLTTCHAQTGSVMLRRACRTLPDWLFATYPIDLPLMVLLTEIGPARLLPEVMGRYRIHNASSWSRSPYKRNQDRLLAMYRVLAAHYAPTRHARTLQRTLCRLYLHTADTYLRTYGQPEEAAPLLRQAASLLRAYNLPLARSLVGVTGRWLGYRLGLRTGAAS